MPLITVTAWSSVPPYSSITFSGPSHSIQACLSHAGHGAARWNATSRLDTSVASRTSSGSRQIRSIIVGTRSIQVTRCFSTRRSVSAALNRGISTTWLPSSIAQVVATNGPLWASGPVIRTQPSRRRCTRAPAGPTSSDNAGWVAPISFGRPVLPPLVMSFHSGETPRVNGPAGRSRGTDSRTGRVCPSDGGAPTTSAGSARSTMASRSRAGRRSEIGCGTAPTAHAANMLSTNPIEFGSPIVTVEPSVTPRLANSAARRSTRSVNSARVSVWSL